MPDAHITDYDFDNDPDFQVVIHLVVAVPDACSSSCRRAWQKSSGLSPTPPTISNALSSLGQSPSICLGIYMLFNSLLVSHTCHRKAEAAPDVEVNAGSDESTDKPLTFAEISALIQSGKTHLIPNNKQIPEGTNVCYFGPVHSMRTN